MSKAIRKIKNTNKYIPFIGYQEIYDLLHGPYRRGRRASFLPGDIVIADITNVYGPVLASVDYIMEDKGSHNNGRYRVRSVLAVEPAIDLILNQMEGLFQPVGYHCDPIFPKTVSLDLCTRITNSWVTQMDFLNGIEEFRVTGNADVAYKVMRKGKAFL